MYAVKVPITALTSAIADAVISVNLSACQAAGRVKFSKKEKSPSRKLSATKAAKGNISIMAKYTIAV